MKVSEAVASRRSVRGFLDQPVAPDIIRRVIEKAARAPSGGNLQPWHIQVLAGEPLDELKALMRQRLSTLPMNEDAEYDIYPPSLVAPYRDRRFQVGEEMYGHIGIPRDDKQGRMQWFLQNFQFFGAPMALFCHVNRCMGPPQWSDLGMYLQTVMLLLREEGIDSCAQECWAIYPQTIGTFLDLPKEHMLFAGMSIGYADPEAPINQLRTQRAPLEEFVQFKGL